MNQLMLGILLAEDPVNTGPDFGKASPVGLTIVVLLLIAVLLLGWSMNRQLKKVPASFDEPEAEAQSTAPAHGTVAEAATEAAAEAGAEGSAGESDR
ncbi:MAG: hypothetical protein ACOYBX_12840 [Mycobacterium sp.]|jgi:hypothetical protein